MGVASIPLHPVLAERLRRLRTRAVLTGLVLGGILISGASQAGPRASSADTVNFWSTLPRQTASDVARCCAIPRADVHLNDEFTCRVGAQTASCFHSAVHATNGRLSAAFRGITQLVSPETQQVIGRLCTGFPSANYRVLEKACIAEKLDQRNPDLLGALRRSGIPADAFRIRLDRWGNALAERSMITLACRRAVGGASLTSSLVNGQTEWTIVQTGTADPACTASVTLRAAAFDASDFSRPTVGSNPAPSPEPASSGPPQLGAPSLRPNEDASEARFDSCMLGYTAAVAEGQRNLSGSQVCEHIRGTALEPFNSEVSRLMVRSNLNAYFEILRMEAIARFLAVQQQWVGTPFTDLPAACAPFRTGIEEARTRLRGGAAVSSTQTPEFAQALHSQARFALRLRSDAIRLANVPSRDCSGDMGPGGRPICTENPDYARAQEELSRIRATLNETLAAFPLLATGRSASDREPWQQLQAATGFAESEPDTPAFAGHLQRARDAIAADVRASITKFCGDRPPEGIAGNELVQIPELTSSVTRSFPQFNALQACAARQAETLESFSSAAHFLATGGCILGAIVTEGALAPACGALSVGLGYAGYASARERLYWTERCNAAGGVVCSDAMYAQARGDYDSAVFMLGMSVAGATLDLPILASQLRGAAGYLSASRMSAFAAEVREAASLTDDVARAAALRRVAAQVSDETAPAAARAAARQRLTERMGESAARGRFPCLFK